MGNGLHEADGDSYDAGIDHFMPEREHVASVPALL
jgi:hypothetical protein